jgi:tripartite-type tricarboxylate transporter receptor subunit TctC
VNVSLWQGVFAPAGTPRAITGKLGATMTASLNTPEVTRLLEAQGAQPASTSPAEFARFLQQERERWLRIVREAKITVN